MAVGDVVSGLSAAPGILDYQPAVGVEVVITCLVLGSGNAAFNLYNGTLISIGYGALYTTRDQPYNGFKMFLNNTNYLRIDANAATSTGYTGVQTK